MRRRLFNLLTVMSLSVCVAVCVLWVRSYYVDDDVWYWGQLRGAGVMATTGRVALWQGQSDRVPPVTPHSLGIGYARRRPGVGFLVAPTAPTYWAKGRVGFGPVHDAGHHWRIVFIPHGLIAAAAAVVPVRWAWSRLGERRLKYRRAMGHCTACGYDLRATPGRCPECGTTP